MTEDPTVPFRSVIPALLTPFDDDLAVAPDRLAENARALRTPASSTSSCAARWARPER